MKIFGSSKNNKHSSGHHAAVRKTSAPKAPVAETKAADKKPSAKKAPSKRMRKLIIALAVIVVVILGAVVGYSMWEAPPDVSAPSAAATPTPQQPASPTPGSVEYTPEPTDPTASPEVDPEELNNPDPTPEMEAEALSTERNDGVYTFLVVGRDKGSNSTDTIIFGKFDTKAHTIDLVNVPRDTLVNIGWVGTPKKINAIYPGYINSGKSGVEGLLQQAKNLLGFDVDFYCVVNIDMVIEVIDALGGVDFDVPVNMDYDDPVQNFHVHLKKGYQHLDGNQAMGVFRFRQGNIKGTGYPRGDLQRIETQQALLMALAGQMLDLGNIPNLKNIIDICISNVETTLSASNMAFFARQFLKCSKDSINFHAVNIGSSTAINGISFVSLPINGWLEIVNEHLNPYKDPITRKNVNMISTTNGYTIDASLGYIAGGYESFFCIMCTAKHGTTKYHAAGVCPPDPTEEPEVSESPEVSPEASPETSPETNPDTSAAPTPSSSPDAGGAATPTPDAGGAATPTPDAGGAATPTPDAGGAATPTPDVGSGGGGGGGDTTPTPPPATDPVTPPPAPDPGSEG